MQRRVRTLWPALVATTFVAATLALGCTGEVLPETVDADTGTAQAFVSIERTVHAQDPVETRAEAFAGVLQTPPDVEAAAVLKLTGLTRELPAEGLCSDGRERSSSVRLGPLSKVELLDAGDLAIDAGTPTSLAPRAFPTVTDLVSGVVYTTRDRDAERLPAAADYRVTASGGSFQAFSTQAAAPAELENVSVDGVALADLSVLGARAPLALSWLPGEGRDLVYVELTSPSGQPALLCAFRDDAGAATIPSGFVPASGRGTFGVHRLRTVQFQAEGLARAELRFDFEVEAEVLFQ
jgi:hypothetical protein